MPSFELLKIQKDFVGAGTLENTVSIFTVSVAKVSKSAREVLNDSSSVQAANANRNTKDII